MAEQSLAEANSAFLQARADRVSKAMTDALAGKLDPPGAQKRAKVASAPKAAAAPAAAPSASVAVAPASVESSPVDADATGLETTEGEETETEAQGDPAAAEENESDPVELSTQLEELKAHGKKRDLRAIEKVLGLEEGSLGANNASWKAYRKRVGEVEARETKHVENEGILIGKFQPAVTLIQHAQKGNLKAYAHLIEHTTGVPIAQFVAHWSKNVEQLDPRVVELERENARLKAQGNLIEAKANPATVSTATQKADEYIATEAKGHPAFKLEGAQEGIRKIWLASFKPATKTFGLSPKAAANEFIKEKRAKAEQEQWILSGKKPPKRAVTRATPRTGSSETQIRKSTLTRQQLIERAANDWQRQKARDRRA